MSDEVGSSSGDRNRKGKQIMYTDDDQKQTGEQYPCSVPSELTAEDLFIFHTVSEHDGKGSLDDLVKEQDQAFQQLYLVNNPLQKSVEGKSSQKEPRLNPEGKNYFDDFDFDPFIVDLLQKEISADPKNKTVIFNKLDNLMEQQQTFQPLDQVNNPFQKSAKGESLQKEIPSDQKIKKKFDDSDFDPFGSNSKDEESQALIFGLEIIENDRLVIPQRMMDNEFPLLFFYLDHKETLHLTDDHGKKWNVTLNYDDALSSYVITTGWSSYLQHYNLKSQDLIQCYRHAPQLNSNHFLIKHQKKYGDSQYLFKVMVSRSNRLRIFFYQVVGHFESQEASSPPKHLPEYTIYVTDYLNQTWKMRLLRFAEEEAYVVVQGWEQYVAQHDLRHKDKIVFCRSNHSTDRNKFLIHHELGGKLGPNNILCEVRLSEADIRFRRLMMPGVDIPSLCRNRDMVKLTDENDKEWFMIMVQDKEGYMIIDGWEGYMKEYELEAGDMVRLYNPACADHDHHYLIECEKKKQKRTEKEEGGCLSENHGDGAAPSQGGSRKRKEKLEMW